MADSMAILSQVRTRHNHIHSNGADKYFVHLQVDCLIVMQKMKAVGMLTNWKSKNKYDISYNAGRVLFKATENSNTMTCQCFGAYRAFEIVIEDLQGNVQICLTRPFDWCVQSMEVYSPPGNPIGSIKQEWTTTKPLYTVRDQEGNVAFIIEGTKNEFRICYTRSEDNVEVIIYTPDGSTRVGNIYKSKSGDYDNFVITFPVKLDVKKKALLLSAAFLIDFNLLFEKNGYGQSQTIVPKVIFLLFLIIVQLAIILYLMYFGFY